MIKKLLYSLPLLFIPFIVHANPRDPNPLSPSAIYQNDLDLLDEIDYRVSRSTTGYCIDDPTLCVDEIANTVSMASTSITGNLDVDIITASSVSVSGQLDADIVKISSYVQVGDGSEGGPSYSNIGDEDTGAYFPAQGQMGFSSNGDTVLRYSASAINAYQDLVPNSDELANLGDASNSWGRLFLGNGSAASPSLTYGDDSGNNTGTYFTGTSIGFSIDGTQTLSLQSARAQLVVGHFDPNTAGSQNMGNSSVYWGDIHYKTLTDQGCLGWFDGGVELRDGRIVPDTEALMSIKKHPTKKTVYGVAMLDYKTFPKVSYKKAMVDGEYLKRDENDEPIGGTDGVEMTSMFSIMIGAIKELTLRVKDLEEQLEKKNGGE